MPDAITEKIIAAAIEVHRHLGPGLLESIYLKSTGLRRALLINFGESRLVDGIRRVSL